MRIFFLVCTVQTVNHEKSKIDIPSSSEYIELFECKKTAVNRYKVSFIRNSLKALAASTKAAIRIAESGVMNIQFLITIPEISKMAFVEFYVNILI